MNAPGFDTPQDLEPGATDFRWYETTLVCAYEEGVYPLGLKFLKDFPVTDGTLVAVLGRVADSRRQELPARLHMLEDILLPLAGRMERLKGGDSPLRRRWQRTRPDLLEWALRSLKDHFKEASHHEIAGWIERLRRCPVPAHAWREAVIENWFLSTAQYRANAAAAELHGALAEPAVGLIMGGLNLPPLSWGVLSRRLLQGDAKEARVHYRTLATFLPRLFAG